MCHFRILTSFGCRAGTSDPELDAKRAETAQFVSELAVRQKASPGCVCWARAKLHQRTWFRGLMIGWRWPWGIGGHGCSAGIAKEPQPPRRCGPSPFQQPSLSPKFAF